MPRETPRSCRTSRSRRRTSRGSDVRDVQVGDVYRIAKPELWGGVSWTRRIVRVTEHEVSHEYVSNEPAAQYYGSHNTIEEVRRNIGRGVWVLVHPAHVQLPEGM